MRVCIGFVTCAIVANLCLLFGGCSKESKESDSQTSSQATSDKIYNSVDEMPRQINDVFVQYPKDALEAKIEGTVHVKMLLSAEGIVEDAQVSVSSEHLSLDKAALETAKKLKFTPGVVDGKPVRMWLYRPFNFRLDQVNK